MSKFSVKKPYTVVVGVIIVLILGYMAFTNLSTDLLPSMNLPYAIVMTTYGGATPEEVEEVVTKPIESSMATIGNINNISSTSSENYSLVILEFNNSANMDSVTIEMRESLDMLESYWPDRVGSPIIMKLNPSMLPVMMTAVSGEGLDIGEVSDLVNNYVIADLESIDGVASVTASGILEESIQVIIRKEKIDALNQKLLQKIDEEFESAGEELAEGRQKLEEGKAALVSGEAAAYAKLYQAQAQIDAGFAELEAGAAELEKGEQELLEKEALLNSLPEQLVELEAAEKELNSGKQQLELAIGLLETQVSLAKEAVDAADSEAVKAGEERLRSEKQQLEAEIIAINNDPALSEEEKTAKVNAATIKLNAVQVKLDGIDSARTFAKQQLEKATKDLNDSKAAMAELLAGQEQLLAGKAQLEEAIAGAPDALAAIEAGKVQIADAKQQMADGRAQLENANAQLNAGRAQAASQMAAAKAEIEAGELQLNEAEEQMESAREDAEAGVCMEEVITSEMVSGILTAQNFSMPAGYITEENISYMVRVGDKLLSLEEAENLVLMDLSEQDLGVVYLKDVADVIVVDNSSEIYAKMDGDHAVLLSVEKQTNFSTADTARKIRDYMSSEKLAGYGLSMVALMDQGVYIDMVIESVLSNLVIGGILAIIILILFLKDIRPTAVVAISIPVSVVFALALMYFSGVTMNIISLSGLALGVGMLVDNSIVVIENIYRLKNLGLPVKEAAIDGAKQVTGAIIASTLTTVCIWTPIIFVEGMTKQLFVDLVLTIGYSLLASLIVALTVVPMMASTVLKKVAEKKHPLFDKMANGYGKSLAWALKYKIVVVVLVIVLLVGSSIPLISKGMEFMGEMDSTQITVTIQMPEDSALEDTAAMSDEVMNRILEMEDVDHVGVMTGSSLGVLSSGSGGSVDVATMYVLLKEERSITSQDAAVEIEKMMEDLSCEVTANGSTMDMSALGGSGVSVQIKGRDLDILKQIANDLAAELEKIEGTVEVSNGQDDPVPELRITVDKEKAMLHFMTVAQVYQQIAAKITAPTSTTTLTVDNKDFEITVYDEANALVGRDALENLMLEATDMTGATSEVPLKDIATITDDIALSSINRDAQQRYITVSAGVDGNHNATLIGNEFKRAAEKYNLPDGYTLKFSGEDESTREAMVELVKLLALGIAIMYLIMVAQFQSLLSPFIVLFTIPLAFTGGFISLLITGNILSVISMVGFVMLCGIIVNNGIVFIDYANQLREEGVEKRQALIETGKTRLRPILMTALTTILAMSTMALGMGTGADMVQPMAIVTIGGLTYGTFMTLYVVPVIYDIFIRGKKKETIA